MNIVILILTLAVMWDCTTGKVPNKLFLVGVFLSQLRIIETASIYDASKALGTGFVLVIILFPLFAIGSIGGGDIKLMMLLPSVASLKESLLIIFLAFILGALIGLIKLIKSHELLIRLRRAIDYAVKCMNSLEIEVYDVPSSRNDGVFEAHQIHFTVPLLLSVLIWMGGLLTS